jgi:hypothetical protein
MKLPTSLCTTDVQRISCGFSGATIQELPYTTEYVGKCIHAHCTFFMPLRQQELNEESREDRQIQLCCRRIVWRLRWSEKDRD